MCILEFRFGWVFVYHVLINRAKSFYHRASLEPDNKFVKRMMMRGVGPGIRLKRECPDDMALWIKNASNDMPPPAGFGPMEYFDLIPTAMASWDAHALEKSIKQTSCPKTCPCIEPPAASRQPPAASIDNHSVSIVASMESVPCLCIVVVAVVAVVFNNGGLVYIVAFVKQVCPSDTCRLAGTGLYMSRTYRPSCVSCATICFLDVALDAIVDL
jgi:hypothetical protein